ncbi:MAG: T9SS type A sorting domain-containing protein [Flavobacteriales bacterium]|nr:T9SS type A sorting domain-containing protein [Flavobacteriales bacterium]
MKNNYFLLLIAAMFAGQLQAQTVTRGPYLQFPTSSSMKVMWRTDVATPARVYYGPTLATVMDNQVDVSTSETDHTVNITGLDPFTEYYFAVSDGSTVLAGADDNHRFRTSPEIGTVQPIRVWCIGDFGKGNEKQMAVKQSMLDHVGDDLPDFWMWLGDNVYDNGTDEEYSTKVFDSIYGYSEIFPRIPFMPCPGNHDYGSVLSLTTGADPTTHHGPYYDLVDVPTNGEIGGVPSNYELYYSFDYGNVHFMSLNSEIGSVTPLQPSWDWTGANPLFSFNGSPFTDWMEADLAANDKPWVVAFIHQPPYTAGSHESTAFYEVYMQAVRENLVPILESYGVDVLITGHSHVYERSYLIHGYYSNNLSDFDPNVHVVNSSSGRLSEGTPYVKYVDGPNPNYGTLYVVQGNSGSSESSASLDHPAMYTGHACDTCVGSTMLYANGDTLSGYYLTKDGEILDDWTILKTHFTGIEEAKSGSPITNVMVSPNPFTQQTKFSFDLKTNLKANVELTDMTGRLIHSFHSGEMAAGKHTYSIDAQTLGLGKGVYLVRVITGKRQAVARLIKVE